MPTEHEYKYVLDYHRAESLRHDLEQIDHELRSIRQGYLAFSKGMTARVREVSKQYVDKWYFTFKQKVGDRVIEVETEISMRDGEDLWNVAVGRLKKKRYVFDDKGETWEVDFFKKGDHLYFILMEVELEEGAERPKQVPNFIKPYLVHEVALDDDRFSNKRLGDVEFATTIYQEITKENYKENYNEYEQRIRPD